MNRRVVIRNLSLATAGLVLYNRLPETGGQDDVSYSIVTDDPDSVVARFKRLGMDRAAGFSISTVPIAASRQDFAVVRHGALVSPTGLVGWEADLMKELRSRTTEGQYLVSLERESEQQKGTVEFRVDGDLVDRVSLDAKYRVVDIPGTHGTTTFSIDNGSVEVQASSCRHELCRRAGIVKSGKIVCAPNRLVATVVGFRTASSEPSRWDAITG